MDVQGQRDLKLLTELDRDPGITQRSLARKLGIALGLTNLYIKRLARKGYIKATTIPSKRIRYLLTPRGFAEKSRLTYQYMQYSLIYYRQMRGRIADVLARLSASGAKRIAIYGTGELAELAYLSLGETDLTLVGFVDGVQGKSTFLSYPVWPIEAISDWNCDGVMIGELDGMNEIYEQLTRAGIPAENILSLVSKA